MDSNNKTSKIPRTDYNLVNQRVDNNVEMIELTKEPAASQTKRGKCSEEWDCFCFSCDCDCLE